MAFLIISILLGYSPNIRKGFTFQKGESFKTQHQRQRREMFVGFSLSQNLLVQRTGIFIFNILRCAAPFEFPTQPCFYKYYRCAAPYQFISQKIRLIRLGGWRGLGFVLRLILGK